MTDINDLMPGNKKPIPGAKTQMQGGQTATVGEKPTTVAGGKATVAGGQSAAVTPQGNGGSDYSGDYAPKGSAERVRAQQAVSAASSPTLPAKGTQEWVAQNSGENAPANNKTVTTSPARQGGTSSTVTAKSSESSSATPNGGTGINGYAELIPLLEKKVSEYKPLSDEELKKLRRRQKAEGIISGISDAVQSVANLWFTHNYAPNMYNAKEGMSAKARERFDKAKAEREAQNDKYFNYALTLGRLKDAAAKEERNYNHTIERERIADKRNEAAEERAQAKEKRDNALFKLNVELQGNKIKAAEAEAKRKGIEAEYAEDMVKSKIETEKSRGVAARASASASSARARYYNRGGSGSGNKYYGNFEGKDYKTKADYDKAVIAAAEELGVDVTEEQPNGTDAMLRPKTKIVRRPISEIAAEVNEEREKRNAKPKKSPTGSTENNKQKNVGKGKKSPTA